MTRAPWLRFAAAACLTALTAILLQARSRTEVIPERAPLESFPMQISQWSGVERTIDKDVLAVLGPGEFMVRDYYLANDYLAKDAQPINLYIAYFPSQRAGDTIHSPKNCLPGAGWSPTRNDRVMLNTPGHAAFPVNRYVIAKGGARKLVLYWYWAHDRGVASEYWAKYYLVSDAIRMNRSDGSLVRITTDMQPGETVDEAEAHLAPFTAQVVPLLDEFIPR